MFLRLGFTLFAASIFLNACAPTSPTSPVPPPAQQVNNLPAAVMASALIKRPLRLGRIDGQMQPLASLIPLQSQSFRTQLSMPRPDIAIAPGFFYGGHDFNNFTIQFAEENVYPAPQGNSLLTVYNQSVKPILAEWDSNARLLESRAQVNAEHAEFIHLPGRDGEPMKIKPLYVFRFASTPKKETLNVYVLDNEIRAHRMVWGEQNIAIDQVKVDSDEAMTIARAAFSNTSDPAGVQVFPKRSSAQEKIIYDLPQNMHWTIHLNQQSRNQLRYFISFNYHSPDALPPTPEPLPEPVPMPEILPAEDATVSNSASAVVIGRPVRPVQHLYGSLEMDAVTGDIKSMNRPVQYNFDEGFGQSEPGFPGVPVESPPRPVDPDLVDPPEPVDPAPADKPVEPADKPEEEA